MSQPPIPPLTEVAALVAAIQQGLQPQYLFFWGHTPRADGQVGAGCLSQWWAAAPFEVGGVVYPTAEHFMMAEKARLFGDAVAREEILATTDPAAAKKLGRSVRGFEPTRWEQHRFDIVVRGNVAKFSQHPVLRDFLLQTGTHILVEASPLDRIWGIGLAADSPVATDPAQWRGLNLLGFALMVVRAQLQE